MGIADEIGKELQEIMHEDDVQKLHKFMEDYDKWYYGPLLDICLEWQATDCALYIIQGKLPHGSPSLAGAHMPPKSHFPTLYLFILYMCEPLVFDLLFTRCEAATQVNRPHAGLLPLHWLLDSLPDIGPLSDWSLRMPVSDLIGSLLAPQVRPKLECARIVAQYTHSLDQVALGYILNGEIIPLAALLLVTPLTKAELNSMKSYTSIKEIASQAIHGQSITRATCYAAALLDIFEEDGDKLTSKFNNPHEGSTQGAQSIINHPSTLEDLNISFVEKLLLKSSEMADIIRIDEMICRDNADKADAKLSFDRYLLFLRSLVEKFEYHDISELLEFNLCYISKVLVHIRGGLPALISPISNFIINNKNVPIIQDMCLLHVVLSSLGKYEYLSKWSPGESLVKLILLFFLQPELKPILECAQMLAERRGLVGELGWNLIRLGQPIQLAGLLLVAHENLVEPSPLDETIMKTVVSKVCSSESVAATAGAVGLCEIFEKAGNTLAEYWSTHNDEHEPVEVIVEVGARIQRSGIQVLSVDVDLTDIYSTSSHPEMLRSICERLGIEIDKTSGLLQISSESPFPTAESVRQGCRLIFGKGLT